MGRTIEGDKPSVSEEPAPLTQEENQAHATEVRKSAVARAEAAQSAPALESVTATLDRSERPVPLSSGRFADHYPDELPEEYLAQTINSLTGSHPFSEREVKALRKEWEKRHPVETTAQAAARKAGAQA